MTSISVRERPPVPAKRSVDPGQIKPALVVNSRPASTTQDDRLKHDAKVHKNCVRQAYPEGYHIDIPVYRIVTSTDTDGKTVTDYELASEDTWTKSDARGVTRWCNNIVGDLNAGEADGNQMRRVTRRIGNGR